MKEVRATNVETGEIVGVFESSGSASDFFGISRAIISRCCNFSYMKNSICKGYDFRFENEKFHNEAIEKKKEREQKGTGFKAKIGRTKRKVIQKDLKGNVLKVWDGGGEIEKELGFNRSAISKVCSNKYENGPLFKGFLWEFEDKEGAKNNVLSKNKDVKKMYKICPKCKKEHLTDVDSMGVAYKKICPICTDSNKGLKKTESGFFKVEVSATPSQY